MRMDEPLTNPKMPNRFCFPTTRKRRRRSLSRSTGSSVTMRYWAKSLEEGWELSTALGNKA